MATATRTRRERGRRTSTATRATMPAINRESRRMCATIRPSLSVHRHRLGLLALVGRSLCVPVLSPWPSLLTVLSHPCPRRPTSPRSRPFLEFLSPFSFLIYLVNLYPLVLFIPPLLQPLLFVSIHHPLAKKKESKNSRRTYQKAPTLSLTIQKQKQP
ncbi:MAG: hypothetical protein J3R72DRAFT_37410 [Linnemannia gamsii]|nr:MAG: hypothetical protein J3R72DRAFT_37410 [Linnemannia gamsii]